MIKKEKEIDPVEIYDTLDRFAEKGPLRDVQTEILNKWFEKFSNKAHTILKMNTGQGKTLVGLLILQSILNKENRPVMYICPNSFLVDQTIAQAKQFGLKVCSVGSDRAIPPEFTNSEAILITTVQYMFHGFSKFGLGAKSIDVEGIVIDDAHACIESIRQATRMNFSKEKTKGAYTEIFELLKEDIKLQGLGTFEELVKFKNNDSSTVPMLPVPYWAWHDNIDAITKIIAAYSNENEIKYAWPIIKDSLKYTDCYISAEKVEIIPYQMPLKIFGSFYNAKSKIYMSATASEDSILIKELGIPASNLLEPLKLDKEEWSGEKMVLIPSLIEKTLNRTEMVHYFGQPWGGNASLIGRIALTPSFSLTQDWNKYGSKIVSTGDINESVKYLEASEKPQTVVFSNRYDGIDLPDNLCRILVIDSIPSFESLEDRYLSSVISNSEQLNRKKAQKIEQGMGRSVRGEKDFSVIVLIGTELTRFVQTNNNQKYFSTFTKKQILIGKELVDFAKEDIEKGKAPYTVFSSLINQLLKRDEGWKLFYKERMDDQSENIIDISAVEKLEEERKIDNLFMNGEKQKAIEKIQPFIDKYVIDDYEKGWYLQKKAKYCYEISKSKAIEVQTIAHRINNYLLLYPSNIEVSKIGSIENSHRAENIKKYISELRTYNELELLMHEISDKLRMGKNSEAFESSFDILGILLGFETQRPDKSYKKGPDNVWAVRENEFFVFECKNMVKSTRKYIYKDETGQMNNSISWFNREYKNSIHTNFMIVGTKYFDPAGGFNEDVNIIREKMLNKLVKNVSDFTKEFKNTDFADISINKISQLLELHDLSIDSLKTYSEESKPYNS
ncbi:hypothetical protein IV70_GL000943 [Carnobacterium maltaromaticum DSM 20342]|nr:hypothetical protein IV70_GL000943 [Carnobacterium maltaromaticum DSM 20342]